jgi:HD-GYP domain-containing protein (c-di-GMP phosphodiesterase class II)
MTTTDEDPRVEALLRAAPARQAEPLTRRDRVAEAGFALALLAVIAALALWPAAPGGGQVPLVVLLVVLQAIARRVTFSMGDCTASPTLVVVVPTMLLLHPALTLAVIVAGGALGRVPDVVRRTTHADHLLLSFGDAWYGVAPALLLAVAGRGEPSLAHWPLYVAALAALLITDHLIAALRMWIALGVPHTLSLRLGLIASSIDCALAPLGLALAVLARDDTAPLLMALPLMGLLAGLGREREERIQNALKLSDAYRGTALLMGEMLEADDPYTGGEHSQGVLALALEVGQEVGLDPRDQRELEFGALLHDIGKLRVPDEILNKPGKLDPAEWAVMKRHPADGQAMLDRIGGVLADVGLVVRGHHERWDGGGYPDGLAGEAIPLAARVICVCDAYSAMTTDRPYRKAMPIADALTELRACSGTQFDPRVVEALERVACRAAPPRLSTLLAA